MALECQHCYCIMESDTGMVNRTRHRCCQCGASLEVTHPSQMPAWFIEMLHARQFIHDTNQAAFAMASGVDKGIRLEDLEWWTATVAPQA